jgi:hypothetical protein
MHATSDSPFIWLALYTSPSDMLQPVNSDSRPLNIPTSHSHISDTSVIVAVINVRTHL